MTLKSSCKDIEMNSSLNSSNSDDFIDELNWTSDFATPGKYDGNDSVLNMSIDSPSLISPCTPPSSKNFTRTGSLKLFETPCTPSTLLRKASQSSNSSNENRSPNVLGTTCSGIKAHYPTRRRSTRLGALKCFRNTPSPIQEPVANPFQSSTPVHEETRSILQSSEKKRRKLQHDEDLNDIKVSLFTKLRQPSRIKPMRQTKMTLDLNQSRYRNEFIEMGLLGKGSFGEVYKCQNRIDRCYYALKRLNKPLAGSIMETAALREVYAHAVLGKHHHILQYYSAWAEDKHMIIQNEYCNGGSLSDMITQYSSNGKMVPERDLKQIMVQVAKGLCFMHSTDLAHLDIKPGNIFISHREVQDDENRKGTSYKIGDLGMVTKISDPQVEEGDVRYLPKELIDDDHSDLAKADVFSLSLTVYEVASLMKLPKNGARWHRIRDGYLDPVDGTSDEIHNLLLKMISPVPSDRPSPSLILKEKFLLGVEKEKIDDLKRRLNEEKIENQRLLRELAKAKDSPLMNMPSSRRLVGKQMNRSMSIA